MILCVQLSSYEIISIILATLTIILAWGSYRTAKKSIDIARQSAEDTARQTNQQIYALQKASLMRSSEADEQIKMLKKEVALQGTISAYTFELELSKIEFERTTAENKENFLKKKVEEFNKAGTHHKLEMDELESELIQLHTKIENMKRLENRVKALAHDLESVSRSAQSGW
jgi:chromosome segregation ATPase